MNGCFITQTQEAHQIIDLQWPLVKNGQYKVYSANKTSKFQHNLILPYLGCSDSSIFAYISSFERIFVGPVCCMQLQDGIKPHRTDRCPPGFLRIQLLQSKEGEEWDGERQRKLVRFTITKKWRGKRRGKKIWDSTIILWKFCPCIILAFITHPSHIFW